jgi:hypothetical protein
MGPDRGACFSKGWEKYKPPWLLDAERAAKGISSNIDLLSQDGFMANPGNVGVN